jgi:uncharacterized damage-inducible protein DinB
MTINGDIKLKSIANFWVFEVKPPIMKALEITPGDKIDWAPAENMITLGNIFMHIAEASSWWIDHVIDGRSYDDWTPCPSFSNEKILTLLDQHWLRLEKFFERSPEVMEKTYELKRGEKVNQLYGSWIMFHLFEHDIHHRCQINTYLRILGITPPQI